MEIDSLIKFRKKLHKYPEISGNEKNTARRIADFIDQYAPDKVINGLGGNGVAFIFNGKKDGPVLLLRAELDALPISEENDFKYKSVHDGKAHKCGHDGHMTILSGVAAEISDSRPSSGKVVLLFQPAEETGEGAKRVLQDEQFEQIKPDYVFALHNIPEYDMGSILVTDEVFASASIGMEIKLTGKTSHAGEPEKGINPAKATAAILNDLIELPGRKKLFRDFALVTIVHVKLGEIAYGTSAGYAEIRCTLRSYQNDDMETLKKKTSEIARKYGKADKLQVEIRFVEHFPALINNKKMTDILRQAAGENDLKIVELKQPFRWSEDFSNFINQSNGAMFGLGSGKKTPKLHNPDYDFPDELIPHGINMFMSIINQILNHQN